MSILGDLKEVAGDIQKLGNIEIYQKVISIQEKIIEVLDKDVDLKEENIRLRNENEIKKVIEFRDDVYWIDSEKPGEKGPYCPRCYDVDKKPVHLLSRTDPGYVKCPSCNNVIRRRWR